VTLFATVLLATCLFASSANAQSAFEGKFTLAQQAYWGHGGFRRAIIYSRLPPPEARQW
jgi:hypothetical protein